MNKLNTKGLGTKLIGLAAGTAATGLVQKGIAKLGLSGMMADLATIGIGAFGPDLLGKKNPMISFAGDAVIAKGMNSIMARQFPALVSGTEDVAGPYDEYGNEVSGAGDYGDYEVGDGYAPEPEIVSGPDDNVAGAGVNAI